MSDEWVEGRKKHEKRGLIEGREPETEREAEVAALIVS